MAPQYGYQCTQIPVQMAMIQAELGHVQGLYEAAAMWRQAGERLALAQKELRDRKDRLMSTWRDGAGQAFGARVDESVHALGSWVDNIAKANLSAHLTAMAFAIPNVHGRVQGLYLEWLRRKRACEPVNDMDFMRDAGASMDWLADMYVQAKAKLKASLGDDWVGPRQALPGPGPGGADPPSPGNSKSAAPADTPAPTEAAPPTTGTETEVKDALEELPNALDALSQAAQSLQGLLCGSGQSLPDPTAFDPSALGSPSAAEIADSLNQLDPGGSGLPSLAGGGGGLPGTGGIGATAVPASASVATPGMTALPIATTGTAARATGSGMMPSMYPPQAARTKAGNGIRPGAAEHAATGRSRKPTGTPGVSLQGRAKGGATRASAAPRRWDPENDTVQLLDEELWQVDQEDSAPRYRAGH